MDQSQCREAKGRLDSAAPHVASPVRSRGVLSLAGSGCTCDVFLEAEPELFELEARAVYFCIKLPNVRGFLLILFLIARDFFFFFYHQEIALP